MRRAVLGTVVGAGIGVFLVSGAIVLTSAWLLYMIFPLLIPIFTTMAGFILGLQMDRRRPPARSSWLVSAASIALIPVCGLLPLLVRYGQIRWLSFVDVPVCSDGVLTQRMITILAFDDYPGYMLEYESLESPDTLVRFYLEELPKRGWKALSSVPSGDHVHHQFQRNGRILIITGWGTWRLMAPDEWVSVATVRVSCCVPNLTYRSRSLEENGEKPIDHRDPAYKLAKALLPKPIDPAKPLHVQQD